ncbi:MAG TPA: hypothetical protein GXZ76_02465, partial [Clostridiaceae bacterium]|nr:hypothetical protein [Clostridiaceae bacterium]
AGDFTATSTNYTNIKITVNPGTLTINAITDMVTVTIMEHSGTELYDGTVKTVMGYTVSSDNDLYTESDFSFNGTASVSGTNAGTYDMALTADDFTNNSDNFTNVTFKIVDGTLTINPKAVMITTGSNDKEYDGSPLTNPMVSIEGLVDGESVTLTATGSQTEVGSSTNTYSIDWGTTDSNNYAITETLGTLTVTTNATAEVKLIAADAEKVYDGTALTKTDGVTWEGLPTGLTVEASSTGSQTNAGESANVVNDGYVIKDGNGVDQTANFTNITKVPGTLTVNPKAVTLISASLEKKYDGTALTNGTTALAEESGWVGTDGATYTFTGSQLIVGESDNAFSYELNAGTLAGNYTINKTEGKLKVTDRSDEEKFEINVVATSNTGNTYDGTEKSAAGFETLTFTVEGNTYTVSGLTTTDPSSTNVATLTNAISGTAVVTDAEGNNVTNQFTVNTTNGTLEIKKRDITVSVADAADVAYNGNEQTGETDYTFTNVVAGQTATITYTPAKGTLPNTYTGSYGDDLKVMAGTVDVTANYNLTTQTAGKLTITDRADDDKYEINVVANSNTDNIYDGTEKSAVGFETLTFTVEGNTYTVEGLTTSDPSSTNVATLKNEISGTAVVKDAQGNDVTSQFKVITQYGAGTLSILPKAVTITTGSASKVYDGTALTEETVNIEGLIDGEMVTLTATGSQTDVGSSDNTYEIEWNNAIASNYTATENLGTLIVTDGGGMGGGPDDEPTDPAPTPDPGTPGDTDPEPAPGPVAPADTDPAPAPAPVVPVEPDTEPAPGPDTPDEPTPEPDTGPAPGPVTPGDNDPKPMPGPDTPEETTPETKPEPTIIIPERETPLADGTSAEWALLNLLLTILTGIIMIVLWITYFTNKKREDEEDEETEAEVAYTDADEDEDRDKLKRKGILRLLSIIPFVVAVIVFILTEDMRNPMVLVDRWTIWMAVIALVQLVLALFCKKSYEEEEEEQKEANA